MIVCLLIPEFAVAVECRADPTLPEAPLLLGEPGHAPERVWASSKAAARLGIRPGMPLRQARLLCPQARLIPANPGRYQQALAELRAVLTNFTRQLELAETQPTALSYLDLPQLKQADLIELAQTIGRTVRDQTGLIPALGLASGKFVARVAALATRPGKISYVAPGREAAFLAPRPIDLLPLDETLARRLQLLGLRRLGQFATLPAGAVLAQFGQSGRWLHQLARGIDDRPVMAYHPQPSEQVSHQFDPPVADQTILIALGRTLASELSARLQANHRVCRAVTLRLALEDGADWSGQQRLRQPTNSLERLAQIIVIMLSQVEIESRVTGLTICLTELSSVLGRQLDLFVPETGQTDRLQAVMPDLVAHYGLNRFYVPTVTDPAACLPECRFQLQAAV